MRKPSPPGHMPPDPAAWCALHQRYMNYKYIKRRRCLMRGSCSTPCKHFHWLPLPPSNHDFK